MMRLLFLIIASFYKVTMGQVMYAYMTSFHVSYFSIGKPDELDA